MAPKELGISKQDSSRDRFKGSYVRPKLDKRTLSRSIQSNSICWKWIVNGEYSAASAYEAQFLGAYTLFCASMIWQARIERKCRFFVCGVGEGRLHGRARSGTRLLGTRAELTRDREDPTRMLSAPILFLSSFTLLSRLNNEVKVRQ
jgi:hypothetical protein